MNRSFSLAAAAALVLGVVSISPASAHGGHHHGGPHGHHHHGHGGHHHHGGGGGWHGSHRHGPHWGGRPIIVRSGPRVFVDRRPIIVHGGPRVFVAGAYPVYGRPAGYGPGCTTTRRVGLTPWGWHKVVTTRTCLVP